MNVEAHHRLLFAATTQPCVFPPAHLPRKRFQSRRLPYCEMRSLELLIFRQLGPPHFLFAFGLLPCGKYFTNRNPCDTMATVKQDYPMFVHSEFEPNAVPAFNATF